MRIVVGRSRVEVRLCLAFAGVGYFNTTFFNDVAVGSF